MFVSLLIVQQLFQDIGNLTDCTVISPTSMTVMSSWCSLRSNWCHIYQGIIGEHLRLSLLLTIISIVRARKTTMSPTSASTMLADCLEGSFRPPGEGEGGSMLLLGMYTHVPNSPCFFVGLAGL